VLEANAQYMEYGKFDPSVNRKRLKILRSRLGYFITLRSRIVVQTLTKIGYMASGINIYSFFQISKKLFWISEKEFVISEILVH